MFSSKYELEEYTKQFFPAQQGSNYLLQHSEHFFTAYNIIKGYQSKSDRKVIVDLGSKDCLFAPTINHIFPFKEIHTIDYGKKEPEDVELKSSAEVIDIKKHYLNAETEPLPFKDESVDIIIFLEILEHFLYDPMYVLLEINRVLKKTGFLLISTPNLNSASSFQRVISGNNPNVFTPYKEPDNVYERHNREYTIREVKILMTKAGFSVEKVITHPVSVGKKIKLLIAILNAVGLSKLKKDELGDSMYLVCKKEQYLNLEKMNVDTRYPSPIYRMREQIEILSKVN